MERVKEIAKENSGVGRYIKKMVDNGAILYSTTNRKPPREYGRGIEFVVSYSDLLIYEITKYKNGSVMDKITIGDTVTIFLGKTKKSPFKIYKRKVERLTKTQIICETVDAIQEKFNRKTGYAVGDFIVEYRIIKGGQ